ncbi:MAG: T9SS type A sorting domain-containing protein [Balneolales bacterium]|nr:T9SS type A sorting domain-containing protein [Balneolales bacterium]
MSVLNHSRAYPHSVNQLKTVYSATAQRSARKSSLVFISLAVLWLITFTSIAGAQMPPPSLDSLANLSALQVAPEEDFRNGFDHLAVGEDRMYFSLRFSVNVLWVSDGTSDNTRSIQLPENIIERVRGPLRNPSYVFIDNFFYFVANDLDADGISSWGVWRTDGTTEGTLQVVDGQTAGYSGIVSLTSVGQTAAIVADLPDGGGAALFLIDDDTQSVQLVEGLNMASNSTFGRTAEFEGNLYVSAFNPDTQRCLLNRVDQSGTVTEVWNSGPDCEIIYPPNSLTIAGNQLYFAANAGSGQGLYRYVDGTVETIFDPVNEQLSGVLQLTPDGDHLYFKSRPWNADRRAFSVQWQLFSLAAGEQAVQNIWDEDLFPYSWTGQEAAILPLIPIGERVLFISSSDQSWWSVHPETKAYDELLFDGNIIDRNVVSNMLNTEHGAWFSTGIALGYTGGTNANTVRIGPASDSLTTFENLVYLNDTVYFSARTGVFNPRGLWHLGVEEVEDTMPPVAVPEQVVLTSPSLNDRGVDLRPVFEWNEVDFAAQKKAQKGSKPVMNEDYPVTYQLKLSTTSDFLPGSVLADSSGIDTTRLALPFELDPVTTYYWKVRAETPDTAGAWSETWVFATASSVDIIAGEQPLETELAQNYPNPFNPATRIAFSLAESEQVTLEVYSVTGERISTLHNDRMPAGRHEVIFDAGDLASGMYLYRLEAGSYTETRTMLLIR